MSAGFTKGPWEVRSYGDAKLCNVRGPNDHPIAQIAWMPETGYERMRADARLIAAAPDLATAVAAWFAYIHADSEEGDAHLEGRLLEAMRTALAKARGESCR